MTSKEIECIRQVLRWLADSEFLEAKGSDDDSRFFYADGDCGPDDMCFYNRDKYKPGAIFQIDVNVFKELIKKLPPEMLEVANTFE